MFFRYWKLAQLFFWFLVYNRNQPFAPADRRNALELTQSDKEYHLHADAQPGIPSIRRTLLKGWKDVDTFTRGVNEDDMQF